MFYLSEDFASSFQGADPFKMLKAVKGDIFREAQGRRTLRFALDGKSYFVKLHNGVGWPEIFKNLLQFRAPVLGAENEWRAISKLQELGVDTMNAVAYGKRGWNPAKQESFIVTEELVDTISLEDYCKDWRATPPPGKIRRQLIERIANTSRILHGNGVCHRDYYLCHFLLHKNSIEFPKLSLIDLHRVLIKSNLAQRWRVKDVAGLLYSSMHLGITERDRFRFIRHYSNKSLRQSMEQDGLFWTKVTQRAEAMFAKLGPAS